MSYISRFFKWVFEGIIHIIKKVILFAITQVISIIRFGWPYVVRVIFFALGIAFHMSLLNLLSLTRGAMKLGREVAESWAEEAVRRGYFPSLHQRTLAEILYVVSFGAINAGFAINLFTVVFTIQLVAYFMATR